MTSFNRVVVGRGIKVNETDFNISGENRRVCFGNRSKSKTPGLIENRVN